MFKKLSLGIWDKFQTVENFASAEYAWTNVKMPSKVFRYSIHQHNCDKGEKIHPTMKPIQLYEWLIINYSEPNQKILDTHLGSNSIGIAIDKANTLDKKNLTFVGIELDEEYFKASVNRFENYKKQLTLF